MNAQQQQGQGHVAVAPYDPLATNHRNSNMTPTIAIIPRITQRSLLQSPLLVAKLSPLKPQED